MDGPDDVSAGCTATALIAFARASFGFGVALGPP